MPEPDKRHTRVRAVDDEPMVLSAFEATLAQAGEAVLMSATGPALRLPGDGRHARG